MNERIKALAEQARKEVNDRWGQDKPPVYPEAHYRYVQEVDEKFAELIIKACTNMLPEDSIRNEEGVHMFYVIRERFGGPMIGR